MISLKAKKYIWEKHVYVNNLQITQLFLKIKKTEPSKF